MLTQALLIVAAVGGSLPSAAPRHVVLNNEHLTAKFDVDDAGLRLTEIICHKTGKSHRFEGDQPVSLFVVPVDAIHDPNLPVSFATQSASPGGAEITSDGTHASVRFRSGLLQIETSYRLDEQAPVLHKTITCKGHDKPAYIAGVREWALKPSGAALVWPDQRPKSDLWPDPNTRLGQPGVLCEGNDGYLLTLEWPCEEVTSEKGEICVGYRPGYRLGPGESREVAAGSIVCFKHTFETDRIEAARRAFFEHLRARVHPTVPCPIKFTTFGPWLQHGNAARVLEVMDDLADVGTNLLHFDAGWQWPDHPYSQRMPNVLNADNETWDRQMTQPERLPDGLLPLLKAAKARGMSLSLWFDAVGCVFVREGEDCAVRDEKGAAAYSGMWEERWPKAPVQALAGEYGNRLREFLKQMQARYDLGGMMFDDDRFVPDYAKDHDCLANGWDSRDVQLRTIMEIFDECERRHPGMYRFLCHSQSWPWALLHVTHIHSGDPGASSFMKQAAATDCPARALAFERRQAFEHQYTRFVPPWGMKGDIAGWSLQQMSPVPVNLAHTDELIPAGEGWTQNMFTCFATTRVRDIRFSFRQMPAFDRAILKKWLAWGQRRAEFSFNCRPLFWQSEDPNTGIVGYSHVGQGRGVIYLFNRSFKPAEAQVRLDENAGFASGDMAVSAYIVYPMNAAVAGDTLSYGEVLKVSLAPKDCVVIEVGLEAPEAPAPYADYEKAIATVKRSFDTLFQVTATDIVAAMKRGTVSVEVGSTKGDRRLAATIVETLGAGAGHRMNLDECLAVPKADAGCRLIIGTHDGLLKHPEAGKLFRETMYERFVQWDGLLVSAPLAVQSAGGTQPTYCLIAPRPEQLARLAINLSAELAKGAKATGADDADARWNEHSITARVEGGRSALRFRPLLKTVGAVTMPGNLDFVRYQIRAQRDGKETLLWSEDIPPFFSRTGPAGWWGDRLVSVADFAGQDVTFRFSAAHRDGRKSEPMARGGFDHIAVLQTRIGPIDEINEERGIGLGCTWAMVR